MALSALSSGCTSSKTRLSEDVATSRVGIDDISSALRVSGARVSEMLSAERHFTADATHQLRTGLTGIADDRSNVYTQVLEHVDGSGRKLELWIAPVTTALVAVASLVSSGWSSSARFGT